MIVISDCLTEKLDEGCLKVANSLTWRLKKRFPNTRVVSYKRQSDRADINMDLNPLFVSNQLRKLLKKYNTSVLYIPFSSNTKACAVRVWVLTKMTKNKVQVIFTLRHPMDNLTKRILRNSGAEIITLSCDSYEFYKKEIGENVRYLKTGVDTEKFKPVSIEQKRKLREKYHVSPDKKVVLHVGHLRESRNVDKLLLADERYHVFLLLSSVTENERDISLMEKFKNRSHTTIIDSYLENVEEIYQMSDVYLFPVQQQGGCIDLPLSVLEAASCNVPIVTTEYGELRVFTEEPGFLYLSAFDYEQLNKALDTMANLTYCNNRNAVLNYDWNHSIDSFNAEAKRHGK